MVGPDSIKTTIETEENISQNTNDINLNKIEKTLKNKIPDDEEKYNKFLNIFTSTDIKNTFTEEEVCSYIESANINLLNRQISKPDVENPNRIVFEIIDNFLGKTINASITTQGEKEKKENKNNQNQEISDINQEIIDIKNDRKNVLKSYDKLDKTKYPEPTAEEVNKGKEKISKETQQKLEQNGLGTDEYAKFLVFEQKYEKNLRKDGETEFLSNFKQLRENLGDQTDLAEMSNPNNADGIAAGALSKYSNDSPALNTLSTPNLPETENFDEEFDMYIKFIDDEKERDEFIKRRNDIKHYKDIYDKAPDEAIKMQEGALNEIEDRYDIAIQKIKEELPTKTKEFAKQRVLGSCITGLAKYFDSSTSIVNKSNFDEDFALDTQDGFSINKEKTTENEIGNDILHMKGNINGSEVGFYYNLTNPEATLQSDDFLSFDETSNTFVFKEGTGGKSDLGVKLPTIDFLTDKAQNILDSDFAKILVEAKNGEEFEAAIKEKISEELLKYYGQEAIVETRVERDIEKNITVQTLQGTFFPDAVLAELSKEEKTINDTNDKNVRKLLEIWDESTEHMRSDELQRFRKLIDRLDPLIEKSHDNLEPRRQKMLEGIDEEKGAETYNDERGKETLKFFRRFSKNGQMNLEDLDVFITGLEKKESIAENMSKYSPDFQTEEDHDGADDLLNGM